MDHRKSFLFHGDDTGSIPYGTPIFGPEVSCSYRASPLQAPDNNAVGNNLGDTGVADHYKIPFYVISSRGLSVYDPAKKNDPNKVMTMLRQNLDWTKLKGCK